MTRLTPLLIHASADETQIDLHWVRALTVPTHLGLIDRPSVSHNLISAQDSPVPLPGFQVAPRLKILMSSGSKKGTQNPFLSKSPGRRIPSRFPNGAPMGRDTRLHGIFTSLVMYLFNISFGVSSKGDRPPKSPSWSPLGERSPVPRALHHSSLKVPGIRAPAPDSRFHSDIQGLLWREMTVSRAFLNISPRDPTQEPSTQALALRFFKKNAPFLQPPSSISQSPW